MLNPATKQKYYQAFLAKDARYDGIFYVAVKTTKIFCISSCSSRKAKYNNCEFFMTAQEAVDALYRPCRRCKPLSYPHETKTIVQKLISSIKEFPEKRWKEKNFSDLKTNAKQASRLFKKRFGITFVAYARAYRIGVAMEQIKENKTIIDTQFNMGYESSSGFRSAFSTIIKTSPKGAKQSALMRADLIDTPLGPMVAIGDEKALYLLEFIDRYNFDRQIRKLQIRAKAAILPGRNSIIDTVEKEIKDYFKGVLKNFKIPIKMIGSSFQEKVWQKLCKIPFGETRSYSEIAQMIGYPSAFRAVARANSTNQVAIIIPCHRVINANGNLGGYAGNIERKKWLLIHEEKVKNG